jgi:GT2 family glycosyltransferase
MKCFKVLICTYNPNDYLIEQVNSIIKNGIADIIISDDSDNSQIESKALLKSLVESNDTRIEVIEGAKKGNASANFLNAICALDDSVEWLFISDQDDVWLSNKVEIYEKSLSKLDANGEPVAICSDAIVVDKKKKIISSSLQSMINRKNDILLTDDILFNNCAQGATLCLNKSMIMEIKRLKDIVDFNCLEDFYMYDWFIAILAKYKGKCIYLDDPTIYYRMHGLNEVGAKKAFNRYFDYIIYPKKTIGKIYLVGKRYRFIVDFLSKEGIRFNNKYVLFSHSSKLKYLISKVFV